MNNLVQRIPKSTQFFRISTVRAMSSDPNRGGGSGSESVGGSGGAGSVRAAGGKFAEREAAFENQYFFKLQAQQLEKLKSHLHDEIAHHEKEIARHQEAIERHKQKAHQLDKDHK